MRRQLPAGLSEDQASVLHEFFAGHISAGRLTQRLGIEPVPSADGSRDERHWSSPEVAPEMRRPPSPAQHV